MKIEGKKIALTGATGGIGRAIAKALAEEGAILLLSGRNKDKLSSLKSELAGNGHIIVVANLESPSDREKFISVARENRVDILINNAGVNDLAFLPRISEKDLKKMIDINLTIPLLLCKQFLPLLQHQTEGVIINIGSILGSIGYPGSTVYCASKFGLRGFTESLRRELAGTNIFCTPCYRYWPY
jgi:short-subunit dehydrogenase